MIDNNFQAELHATDFSNVMFEHEPHSLFFFLNRVVGILRHIIAYLSSHAAQIQDTLFDQ